MLPLMATLMLAAPPALPAGVKKIEAAFDPAEAKPGQTVTLKLTVTLDAGYFTYPTVQPDDAAEGMVNKLTFPAAGTVVFVGAVADPEKPDTKAEPVLGIKELRTHKGTLTYSRKAVVAPAAAAGDNTVTLTAFKISVCDANNCFPPKTLTPAATLKVLPGPAVAVDKDFAAEVAKALEKK